MRRRAIAYGTLHLKYKVGGGGLHALHLIEVKQQAGIVTRERGLYPTRPFILLDGDVYWSEGS